MNKTLQYILIFIICFAAAALVGRMLKSDEEKPSLLEQIEHQDTTTSDTVNIELK